MDTLTRYNYRMILPCIAIFAAALAFSAVAADNPPAAAPAVTPATGSAPPVAAPRKPAAEMVRTVSFKLKDGRSVAGRIVSDDRGQVTVAELIAGKILPTSYSRQDMEPRSINYQTVSEYQYWMNSGQFFESHTWDWQDDADEFAQALRCYQTAQDLATAGMGKDSTAAQDADERVKKVLDSRQRWIETARPRAEMAELELKSTLAQRLDNINKSLITLQSNVDVLNQSRANNDAAMAAYQRDINTRLDRMSDDIRRYYDAIRNTVYTNQGVIVTPYPTPAPMPAK
jgi:hypothetical protein